MYLHNLNTHGKRKFVRVKENSSYSGSIYGDSTVYRQNEFNLLEYHNDIQWRATAFVLSIQCIFANSALYFPMKNYASIIIFNFIFQSFRSQWGSWTRKMYVYQCFLFVFILIRLISQNSHIFGSLSQKYSHRFRTIPYE